MRIRNFIALMVAAIMLPLLLASAFAVNKIWQEEHATAIASLQKSVEATALIVDRDIQASLSSLRALGNSEHLQTGNFEAFYAQAKDVDTAPDMWTGLFEADGTQLLNTFMPFEARPATLRMSSSPEIVAQAHVTQKPVVSDVFVSAGSGKPRVAVYSPTAAVGAKRYVVAQGYSLERWKNIAKQQDLPADWIVAVIDRKGRFIARSHKSDELLGKPARPELVAAAAQKNEGMFRHTTVEGIDSYDAFDHSELTGWTIAIAAPVKSIDGPVVRAVQIVLGGFVIALLASGVMAALFGRRLVAALHIASTAAVTLGRGKTPSTAGTSIFEVDELNRALTSSGQLLNTERLARQSAEQERQRLLEIERLARETADRESQAKDNFLAMLGHELRNPLAAISGAVTVLSVGNTSPPDAHRYLGIIRRQNRHLVHIVDDLLDMSRLIAGKIELDLQAIDLADCVHSCVDGLKAAERLGAHTLQVAAEPVWMNADPVRVEQIIINLIGNALKFSPHGSTIQVKLHQTGAHAMVCVQDQGIGMTPELMAQIFEPFVQGPAPTQGLQSGMGVGLALVRQLVSLHGGTVSVASAGPGRGSAFTCQFPSITAPSTSLPTAPTSGFAGLSGLSNLSSASSTGPPTLLYVEDNADARAVMSEILALSGYDLIEAASGAQALAAVALRRPDAILLDIGLPDMNGYALARQIHQLANGCDVPIIAMTGYGQARDKDTAAQAGFSAHLVKPVDPDELTRTLEAVLGLPPRPPTTSSV